jgi:histidyl-tRNA synthetase
MESTSCGKKLPAKGIHLGPEVLFRAHRKGHSREAAKRSFIILALGEREEHLMKWFTQTRSAVLSCALIIRVRVHTHRITN